MIYIYILDAHNISLDEIALTEEQFEYYKNDVESVIEASGHNINDCVYMTSEWPLLCHRNTCSEIIPEQYKIDRLC